MFFFSRPHPRTLVRGVQFPKASVIRPVNACVNESWREPKPENACVNEMLTWAQTSSIRCSSPGTEVPGCLSYQKASVTTNRILGLQSGVYTFPKGFSLSYSEQCSRFITRDWSPELLALTKSGCVFVHPISLIIPLNTDFLLYQQSLFLLYGWEYR